MSFCDFCDCSDCKTGDNGLFKIYHANTSEGKWICDICYAYDVCTSGPNRSFNGPCKDKLCEHRPKLISEWKLKDEVSEVSK